MHLLVENFVEEQKGMKERIEKAEKDMADIKTAHGEDMQWQ